MLSNSSAEQTPSGWQIDPSQAPCLARTCQALMHPWLRGRLDGLLPANTALLMGTCGSSANVIGV